MSARPVFDAAKFWADLDTIRRYRMLSWRELAKEAGVHASLLSRMAASKAPDIDNLMRLLTWSRLDLPNYVLADSLSPAVSVPGMGGGEGHG